MNENSQILFIYIIAHFLIYTTQQLSFSLSSLENHNSLRILYIQSNSTYYWFTSTGLASFTLMSWYENNFINSEGLLGGSISWTSIVTSNIVRTSDSNYVIGFINNTYWQHFSISNNDIITDLSMSTLADTTNRIHIEFVDSLSILGVSYIGNDWKYGFLFYYSLTLKLKTYFMLMPLLTVHNYFRCEYYLNLGEFICIFSLGKELRYTSNNTVRNTSTNLLLIGGWVNTVNWYESWINNNIDQKSVLYLSSFIRDSNMIQVYKIIFSTISSFTTETVYSLNNISSINGFYSCNFKYFILILNNKFLFFNEMFEKLNIDLFSDLPQGIGVSTAWSNESNMLSVIYNQNGDNNYNIFEAYIIPNCKDNYFFEDRQGYITVTPDMVVESNVTDNTVIYIKSIVEIENEENTILMGVSFNSAEMGVVGTGDLWKEIKYQIKNVGIINAKMVLTVGDYIDNIYFSSMECNLGLQINKQEEDKEPTTEEETTEEEAIEEETTEEEVIEEEAIEEETTEEEVIEEEAIEEEAIEEEAIEEEEENNIEDTFCSNINAIIIDDNNCIVLNSKSNFTIVVKDNLTFYKISLDLDMSELSNNILKIMKSFSFIEKNNSILDNSIFTIMGYNFEWYAYNSSILFSSLRSSLVNAINLTNCEDVLKSKHNLPENYQFKNALIIKDLPTQQIPQIEYGIFDTNGNQFDLTKCSSIVISVSYSLEQSSLMNEYSLGLNYQETHDIDIFNVDDSIYNDICTSFTWINGRDTIVDDRQKWYSWNFNYTLCEDNCEYQSIDYSTNSSECHCTVKSTIQDINTKNWINLFKKAGSLSHIQIVKCYNVFWSSSMMKANIGFYIQWCLFLWLISLTIVHYTHDASIIKKTIYDNWIYNKSIEKVSKFQMMYQKKTRNNIGKSKIQFLYCKNQKIQLDITQNKINIDKNSNNQNQESNNNNSKLLLTNLINISNKNNNNNNHNNSYQSSMVNIIKKNSLSISSKIKSSNSLEWKISDKYWNKYTNYVVTDKKEKTILQQYWIILKFHHCILNLILAKSILPLHRIKLTYLLNIISLNLALNALLYNNKYISMNSYEKSTINSLYYTITKQIVKILYAFVLSFLIEIPMFYWYSSYNTIDKILNKEKIRSQKGKKTKMEICKVHNLSRKKIMFFSCINIILMLFYLYYTTIFCGIYSNSQYSWLWSCGISWVFEAFSPFIVAIGILVIILLCKKFQFKHVNKVMKYLKKYT